MKKHCCDNWLTKQQWHQEADLYSDSLSFPCDFHGERIRVLLIAIPILTMDGWQKSSGLTPLTCCRDGDHFFLLFLLRWDFFFLLIWKKNQTKRKANQNTAYLLTLPGRGMKEPLKNMCAPEKQISNWQTLKRHFSPMVAPEVSRSPASCIRLEKSPSSQICDPPIIKKMVWQ